MPRSIEEGSRGRLTHDCDSALILQSSSQEIAFSRWVLEVLTTRKILESIPLSRSPLIRWYKFMLRNNRGCAAQWKRSSSLACVVAQKVRLGLGNIFQLRIAEPPNVSAFRYCPSRSTQIHPQSRGSHRHGRVATCPC